MKATFDPAKNLDLYFRKGRNGSKTLTFSDEAGDPFELIDDFEFRSAFEVTLTIEDNTIKIDFDKDEQINRTSYFWELVNTTTGKTWLCGTAFFTDGLSADISDFDDLTISLNGEEVTITINESGGSGDVNGGTP